MQILVDTSVLIDALRLRRQRRELLYEVVEAGHSLVTTAINVAEIYAGMRQWEEPRTNSLLDTLLCYDLTKTTARLGGTLKSEWANKGRTLALADAIIAAIAIERNCTLMTDNRKDFPMPQLNLFPLP